MSKSIGKRSGMDGQYCDGSRDGATVYTHLLYQPHNPTSHLPISNSEGFRIAQSPPELGDLGGETASSAKQKTGVYTVDLRSEATPSSPAWYAIGCLSFDLVVATYIGVKADKEDMMNRAKRSQQVLIAIILLNLISTWFHYTDNALFLDQYPGPEWITAAGILSVVSVMTPIGMLGYWLYTKGMFGLAYLFLGLYSMTSVSSPVHYFFPAVVPMSAKMHGSIWLDGVSGVLLIGFVLWSSIVAQEWRRMPITD